jgi:hypothetical protein
MMPLFNLLVCRRDLEALERNRRLSLHLRPFAGCQIPGISHLKSKDLKKNIFFPYQTS